MNKIKLVKICRCGLGILNIDKRFHGVMDLEDSSGDKLILFTCHCKSTIAIRRPKKRKVAA